MADAAKQLKEIRDSIERNKEQLGANAGIMLGLIEAIEKDSNDKEGVADHLYNLIQTYKKEAETFGSHGRDLKKAVTDEINSEGVIPADLATQYSAQPDFQTKVALPGLRNAAILLGHCDALQGSPAAEAKKNPKQLFEDIKTRLTNVLEFLRPEPGKPAMLSLSPALTKEMEGLIKSAETYLAMKPDEWTKATNEFVMLRTGQDALSTKDHARLQELQTFLANVDRLSDISTATGKEQTFFSRREGPLDIRHVLAGYIKGEEIVLPEDGGAAGKKTPVSPATRNEALAKIIGAVEWLRQNTPQRQTSPEPEERKNPDPGQGWNNSGASLPPGLAPILLETLTALGYLIAYDPAQRQNTSEKRTETADISALYKPRGGNYLA